MSKVWVQRYEGPRMRGYTVHRLKKDVKTFWDAKRSEGNLPGECVGVPFAVEVDDALYDLLEHLDGQFDFGFEEEAEGSCPIELESFLEKLNGCLWVKRADAEPADAVPVPARTTKARAATQFGALGSAVTAGVAFTAIDQAGELLLDAAKDLARDVPFVNIALEHPEGRELAKVLMALLVHTAAHHTNFVPKSAAVARVAERQVTLSTFKIIGPRVGEFRKLAMGLAAIGEALPETESLPSGAGFSIENLIPEAPQQKVG